MAEAPERVIRRYLDEHGGRTTATLDNLLLSFDVAADEIDGRRRIEAALASAGVQVDQPLDRLNPDDRLALRVAKAPPSLIARQPGMLWGAVSACLLMIVGSLGPWATALNVLSVSGLRGDGWLVIAAAVLSLGMLWNYATRGSRGLLIGTAATGAAATLVVVIDLVQLDGGGSDEFFGRHLVLAEPAWGIYIVIGASLALAVFSLLLYGSTAQAARSYRDT